jgi:DNA-binding SARP family transcriptional activator
MMINYEILGKVTARRESQREGQSLALPAQQQLLLARLVCARGAAVTQRELTRAVWGQGAVPDGGLKSAVWALRSALREELAAEDILVHDGVAYRLLLDGQQVDAFRFTGRLDEAGQSAGPERDRLVREALKEWGPQASGLFGGYPLLGLDGGWARGMRRKLREQYRNVVIQSLRRDVAAGDWESLLRQCGRLALEDQEDPDHRDPQDAMADTGFLELWMLAAYRSSQPDLAEQVLHQATEAATESGRPVRDDLARVSRRLRDEALRPGALPSATAAASASISSPASDGGATSESRAMSEPTINLNNQAGSVVKGQVGVVNGAANFYLGDSSAPPEEESSIVMNAQAAGGSRVNQAGRDQTVTGA